MDNNDNDRAPPSCHNDLDSEILLSEDVSPIGACPEELLLLVADVLGTKEKQLLALTCRRFSRIFQCQLYREIELPHPGLRKSTFSHIAALVRTLLRRPDLACKTRELEIYAVAKDVLFEHKHTHAVSKDLRATMSESNCNVSEARLAGVLLTLLPNLRALTLAVFDDWPSYVPGNLSDPLIWPEGRWGTYSKDSLGELFGPKRLANFSSIPGLRNLETIILQARQLDPAWTTLPNLKYMWLNRTFRSYWMSISEEIPPASSISHLTLTPSVLLLVPAEKRHKPMKIFLSQLTGLRCLRISFDDSYNELRYRRTTVKFDDFIEVLSITRFTLEELHLGSDDGVGFLKLIQPVTTLSHFTRLRILGIQQEALIGPFYNALNSDHVAIYRLLPSSLELLRIWGTTLCFFDWLERLFAARFSVPKLKDIEMVSELIHGDGYEKIAYREHMYPVLAQLRAHGINAHPMFVEDDENEDWYDDDYDPLAYDFLEALQT